MLSKRLLASVAIAVLLVMSANTATASAATAPRSAAYEGAVGKRVLMAINASRAAAKLPALKWSGQLQRGARQHNLRMAATNTMSHRLPNEHSLGWRVRSTGIKWTYASENIGWTSQICVAGALHIEALMMAEKAPNDGHRQNILSRSVTRVGIDILVDTAHHKLWLTEDFAN
jgi:uncharacterized protein YkwD